MAQIKRSITWDQWETFYNGLTKPKKESLNGLSVPPTIGGLIQELGSGFDLVSPFDEETDWTVDYHLYSQIFMEAHLIDALWEAYKFKKSLEV